MNLLNYAVAPIIAPIIKNEAQTATIKGITEEGKLKLLHENGSEVAYEEKAIAFTAFVRS